MPRDCEITFTFKLHQSQKHLTFKLTSTARSLQKKSTLYNVLNLEEQHSVMLHNRNSQWDFERRLVRGQTEISESGKTTRPRNDSGWEGRDKGSGTVFFLDSMHSVCCLDGQNNDSLFAEKRKCGDTANKSWGPTLEPHANSSQVACGEPVLSSWSSNWATSSGCAWMSSDNQLFVFRLLINLIWNKFKMRL